MAGQTIVNYDGLSAEAAGKLSSGLVEAARVKMDALAEHSMKVSKLNLEDAQKVERLFAAAAEGNTGNCGIGCW